MSSSDEVDEAEIETMIRFIKEKPEYFRLPADQCIQLLRKTLKVCFEKIENSKNKRGYGLRKKIVKAHLQMVNDKWGFSQIISIQREGPKNNSQYRALLEWENALLPIENTLVRDPKAMQIAYNKRYADDSEESNEQKMMMEEYLEFQIGRELPDINEHFK